MSGITSDRLRYEADGMFAATQGEDYGDTFYLQNWHDKPHRVVYDAVDLLRSAADEIDKIVTIEEENKRLRGLLTTAVDWWDYWDDGEKCAPSWTYAARAALETKS